MKSKMNLIAAAAAAFACTQAQAYGPTQSPDVTIYIAGGSANANAALAFMRKLLQSDGNLNTYTDDTTCSADGSISRAVFGTFISSPTTLNSPSGPYSFTPPTSLAGKKVFIEYNSNGGAFGAGIDGPVRAHSVSKYQTFLNNSTACSAGSALGSTYYAVTNTATTQSQIPLLGLADAEITLFTGLNLPAGSTAVAASEASNYHTQGTYEAVFGLVEDNVLAAQKTSFSSAEITAIFSGNYTDWSQLTGDVGTFAGQPLPAGSITVIDRAAGTAAKAAFNQFFFNNPGSKTAGQLNPQSTGSFIGDCGSPATSGAGHYDETSGGNDCPESSNGNVKKAIDNANTASARAVGIGCLELQPGTSDGYTFAALDGVRITGTTTKTCGNAAPYAFEPANAVSGAYPLFYTGSLQYRIKSLNGANYSGDGTVYSDFIGAFAAVATDPATQVSVAGGLLDPVIVGAPAGNPWDACITKGTHNLQSTSPLQLQF